MRPLKIAILGTRGIPNNYGGFEQATEYISTGLANKGHQVTVYNSSLHPYQGDNYRGVKIVRCADPERILKTAGQFVYDFNSIRDASKEKFDILLFMGYTSSSIWFHLFPKNAAIVSNMDGLEWKRTKYIRPVRDFLRKAEKWAVHHSHFLISDSIGIQQYLAEKYGAASEYIPYGAVTTYTEDKTVFQAFSLEPQHYYMVMARMEPENNIEVILDGFSQSNSDKSFIVVGRAENKFGNKLLEKFSQDRRIRFVGALYDQNKIHTLRKHAALYFHGHSVGGTNPSLLEAMASKCAIVAHDNVFNREILNSDGWYFSTSGDVRDLINAYSDDHKFITYRENNYKKIIETFNWDLIVRKYDEFLIDCFERFNHGKTIRH
jgi:glycosyltransferase involved in cell wall biosynthesis